jgi:hypothetical protein
MGVAGIGSFQFVGSLWQHDGDGGWHFVTVPREVSAEIADITAGTRRGFGSVRVTVMVGAVSWRTSVFPDKSGMYQLPVRRAVRLSEQIEAGDDVHVRLELLDPR